MSAAADAEDKTEKSPVTPGPLAPARELYGQMLLERGMAKEALAAFEASKAKEPNRFHGYAGAAHGRRESSATRRRRARTTRSSSRWSAQKPNGRRSAPRASTWRAIEASMQARLGLQPGGIRLRYSALHQVLHPVP